MNMVYENAKSLGMTPKEWEFLVSQLERAPSHEELQMIAVMWSEHCSYKSSKWALKKFISTGPQVLQGPGENAGLVSFDETRAIAFKVESHNHPSYIEPFQGAATGVGGILRDIFTMGARPIAIGNFLRFGDLRQKKQQFLLKGVVSGISHYGNCVGIPNVCGQVHFDSCYDHNILVNVLAVGLVDKSKIYRSNTGQAGASVMIWGAKTGRDGIHGASLLASADFESSQKSSEQKIRVQVGDPFKEKCLMEACLEAMETMQPELFAIQDMGAAGITCATMEMSSKSGVGMRFYLDKVPLREEGMKPFEILLSESQERMLAFVKKGSEEKFKAILKKWQCEAEVVGETTSDGFLKMSFGGEQIVNLPVQRLMDPPPADLPSPSEGTLVDLSTESSTPADVKEEWKVLTRMLSEPRIASKAAIYERYDSTVGAATRVGPGSEAAVLWLGNEKNPHIGLGIKGAWDECLAQINPRLAAHHAAAECVRALACVGAEATALTDGVNLGNPQNPDVQSALIEIVEGLNDAIRVFDTPCIGGNVSLYNQTVLKTEDGRETKRDIFPTVFTVMVGRINDVRKTVPSFFQKAGNEIWLLETPGNPQSLPVGSVYSRLFWDENTSAVPWLDLFAERNLQKGLLAAHERGLFTSVRDIGDGGLAVALAEGCFGDPRLGLEADFTKFSGRRDFHLFHEGGGRVIVEIEASRRAELMKFSMEFKLDCKRVGQILADPIFRIRPLLTGSLNDLFAAWRGVF